MLGNINRRQTAGATALGMLLLIGIIWLAYRWGHGNVQTETEGSIRTSWIDSNGAWHTRQDDWSNADHESSPIHIHNMQGPVSAPVQQPIIVIITNPAPTIIMQAPVQPPTVIKHSNAADNLTDVEPGISDKPYSEGLVRFAKPNPVPNVVNNNYYVSYANTPYPPQTPVATPSAYTSASYQSPALAYGDPYQSTCPNVNIGLQVGGGRGYSRPSYYPSGPVAVYRTSGRSSHGNNCCHSGGGHR